MKIMQFTSLLFYAFGATAMGRINGITFPSRDGPVFNHFPVNINYLQAAK